MLKLNKKPSKSFFTTAEEGAVRRRDASLGTCVSWPPAYPIWFRQSSESAHWASETICFTQGIRLRFGGKNRIYAFKER